MNPADGHPKTLIVRGETIEAALEQARGELGVKEVRVLNATRMRRGGVGGFFAKDLGVELTVAPTEGAASNESRAIAEAMMRPVTPAEQEYVTEASLTNLDPAKAQVLNRPSAPALLLDRPDWADSGSKAATAPAPMEVSARDIAVAPAPQPARQEWTERTPAAAQPARQEWAERTPAAPKPVEVVAYSSEASPTDVPYRTDSQPVEPQAAPVELVTPVVEEIVTEEFITEEIDPGEVLVGGDDVRSIVVHESSAWMEAAKEASFAEAVEAAFGPSDQLDDAAEDIDGDYRPAFLMEDESHGSNASIDATFEEIVEALNGPDEATLVSYTADWDTPRPEPADTPMDEDVRVAALEDDASFGRSIDEIIEDAERSSNARRYEPALTDESMLADRSIDEILAAAEDTLSPRRSEIFDDAAFDDSTLVTFSSADDQAFIDDDITEEIPVIQPRSYAPKTPEQKPQAGSGEIIPRARKSWGTRQPKPTVNPIERADVSASSYVFGDIDEDRELSLTQIDEPNVELDGFAPPVLQETPAIEEAPARDWAHPTSYAPATPVESATSREAVVEPVAELTEEEFEPASVAAVMDLLAGLFQTHSADSEIAPVAPQELLSEELLSGEVASLLGDPEADASVAAFDSFDSSAHQPEFTALELPVLESDLPTLELVPEVVTEPSFEAAPEVVLDDVLEETVAPQRIHADPLSAAIAERLFAGLTPKASASAPVEPVLLDLPDEPVVTKPTAAEVKALEFPVFDPETPLSTLIQGLGEDFEDKAAQFVNLADQLRLDPASNTLAVDETEEFDAFGAPLSPKRAQFEVDVAAWVASRNVREGSLAAEREASETRKMLPDWRIETWKASRAARDHQELPPVRTPTSQHVIARLSLLGVPESVLEHLELGETLQEALSPIPCISPDPAGVTLVVGKAELVRQWANGLGQTCGIAPRDITIVTNMTRTGEISTVEAAQQWRVQQLEREALVAFAMNAPSTNLLFAKRMVGAVKADTIRLVVEADDVQTAQMWARIAPRAVLDVVGVSRARKPGALLAMGMPIATVDGEPATKATLALALLEQSAR